MEHRLCGLRRLVLRVYCPWVGVDSVGAGWCGLRVVRCWVFGYRPFRGWGLFGCPPSLDPMFVLGGGLWGGVLRTAQWTRASDLCCVVSF